MDDSRLYAFFDELEKISSRLHHQAASTAYNVARKAGKKTVKSVGKKKGKGFLGRLASGVSEMGDVPIWQAPKKFSEGFKRG